ncbi:MAG: histidine triad nucleotide-binding protein [Patescibacteria group bacterium]
MDCLFCKIAAREIPVELVWEGDGLMAFKDKYPKAPVHVLIIPVHHIESLAQTTPADMAMLGKLLAAVPLVAEQVGLRERGFKTVINTGVEGGQEVPHLHVHVLGGG